jgi:hypothetical protein
LIGTRGDGLFLYDGTSLTPFPTEFDSVLKSGLLYRGIRLRDGTFALTTTSEGMGIVDRQGHLVAQVSRTAGLPLWDLLYFLTDALAVQAARSDDLPKHEAVPRLLRGELAASNVLFGRLAEAAKRLEVPQGAVGAIATLAWLEHSRSPGTRAEIAALHDAEAWAVRFPLEEVASYWLEDSLLGLDWPAYARTLPA